jgi:hypothetical protein
MYPVFIREPKSYGFFNFVFDCFMVFLTLGLWLIWIFCREMRKRNTAPWPYG